MGKDIKYFNFPVVLLENFLTDHEKCLEDIIAYAIYTHSLKLENGNQTKKINDSASYFNVQLGSAAQINYTGKTLHDSIDLKCPKVGLSTSIYWDFRNNEKNEFDKVCLIAFLAIKSIIQQKPYIKIDNKFWLARMDGKAKSCEFSDLSDSIIKYANEYQTKKIKTALRNSWGLVTYSRYTRGFYVSFTMTLESLVLEAEKRRLSTKDKQHKQVEKNAVTSALLKLGVNTTKERP